MDQSYEDSSKTAPPQLEQTPKVMYDTGHDNKVFVSDGSVMQQPHLARPHNNNANNTYYVNGANYPNGMSQNNGHAPQSFRIIENSRL